MPTSKDPTEAIRKAAADFDGVANGTSCNQSSFKTDTESFLFIGPGRKGIGSKAMFKLKKSLPDAVKRAAKDPDRFEVGTTSWVTARFTAEKPLPKSVWGKWLDESYNLACSKGSARPDKGTRKAASKASGKRTPAQKK